MRGLKLFGISLVAMLMLGALTSASALAVESPEFTVETTMAGKSPASTLTIGALSVGCKKDKMTLTFASRRMGSYTIDYEECKLSGESCRSLGDAAGVILLSGEWKLVVLNHMGVIGTLMKRKEVHIECGPLTLILVRGSGIFIPTPVHKKAKSFEDDLNVKEGKQEVTEYENEKEEKVKVAIEASINGGAFGAAVESSDEELTAEKETEII
jgi:hypothetical protein